MIFAISILAYQVIARWGGLQILEKLLKVPLQAPSVLYFCGVALIAFSVRRIMDQRRERNKRLAAEYCDPLTRLPNRRQFQAELSAALTRSNNVMSVLLIGLDHFKRLNEIYGHLGCDEALVQIGLRIRDCLKSSDTLARVSDDEFAVCLPQSDPDRVHQFARSIIESINNPLQIGIESHSISARVGITQAGRGHMTVDELLRCAHVALSRARIGQADCCFFDPKMDANVRERSLIERDLKAALGGRDIRPHYQPIVDLRSKRIVSFESLARWSHPINGLIAPDIFIPIAEELGLIDILSGQLFGDACRDAASWPDYVSLSFNFSPSQLSNRTFAQDVLTVLSDAGLPPYRLEAEITENALVTDFGATRHALEMLRNAGVRIVIDDFGAGYSGLSQLYQLRFDKLKIDKRFVQDLGKSKESDSFVRAIFGLCKGLELLVTAEGIETTNQADAVCKYGAQQGQGLLFGEAVPASAVMRILSGSQFEKLIA